MPPHFVAQIDPFPTTLELAKLHELCGVGVGKHPDKLGAVKRYAKGTAATKDKLLVIALTRQLRLDAEGTPPKKRLSHRLSCARNYEPTDWWLPAGISDDPGSGRID